MTAAIASAYDLCLQILQHPAGGVQALIDVADGGECEWLEFKASVYSRPEDRKPGEHEWDAAWHVARAVIALANTRGGVVLLGVDDHGKAVGLHDPKGKLAQEGPDAYRRAVLDRLVPPDGVWPTSSNKPLRHIPDRERLAALVELRSLRFQERDILAVLVRPVSGRLLRTWEGKVESVLRRAAGAVGRVEEIIGGDAMQQWECRAACDGSRPGCGVEAVPHRGLRWRRRGAGHRGLSCAAHDGADSGIGTMVGGRCSSRAALRPRVASAAVSLAGGVVPG